MVVKRENNSGPMENLANDLTDGNIPDLAEKINDFLQSITSDIPPLPESHKYQHIENTNSGSFTISVDEVEINLSKIKMNKSAGPDGIQTWMLRYLAPLFAKPVAAIYNSSIRDGYIPDQWKSVYM